MPKRDCSEIVVLGLECTCYENNNFPNGEKQDIIEIGACRLNVKTLQISDKISILIKPERSSVSEYCTSLTGIVPEDAESGCTLEEGLTYLQDEYSIHIKPWASYGAFDRKAIERQCRDQKIKFPYTDRHINIKLLFPLVFSLSKEYGLKKALSKLNMEFEGIHHNGDDDAWNAAKVLRECFRGGKIK